ncbi:MAG: DNA repair protein RecO [Verrucomicrobia bacterium]|nr:DNA repair protein RecO [Verrucomicrobiota bacterium]
MTESTSGIILRVRPLTETSLIVHWLTPELGRIATVAKGARRPKSSFRGKLDLFYEADFSFQRSRRSELHALREVSLRGTNETLRTELGRLQQACYAAALVEQTTETETPLPAVFELMAGLLRQLPQQPPQPLAIFAFEMKLLHELGQSPDLAEGKLTPGARKILEELTLKNWPALLRLKLSAPQTREIQQFLHGFLIWHLGKIPGGRNAALATD